MRWLLCSALLVLTALPAPAQDEPTFQGKKAGEWAKLLSNRETGDDAEQVLREGGKTAVPVLARLLTSEPAGARGLSADVLGGLGEDAAPAVPALVRALVDEDRGVASSAMFALELIGPSAGPAVVAALDSEEPELRARAAEALSHLDEAAASAVPRLIEMLRSGAGAEERRWAAEALRRAGEAARPAVPALVAALADDSPGVRRASAVALGWRRRDTAVVVPALVRVLGDTDSEVRRAAMASLGRFGHAAAPAVPGLIRALGDEAKPVREAAVKSLRGIGEPAVSAMLAALRGEDEATRARVIPALARCGEAVVPRLVPLLRAKEEAVRKAAEETLVLVGWVAIPALEAAGAGALRDRVIAQAIRSLKVPKGMELIVGEPPTADTGKLRLVWETGSGHGFTLSLMRLRWVEGGLRIDRVGYRSSMMGHEADRYPVEAALLPAARAKAVLALLLRVAGLRLEKKPAAGIGSGWSTTADFHSRVGVFAGDRILLDESYTGYAGSLDEVGYFRVQAAARFLREAVQGLEWKERKVTDADLAELLARTGRIADDGWWVQERLLLIVGAIGDHRFVPFLVEYIKRPLDDVPRDHVYAIDAYARITGVDLRPREYDEDSVGPVRKRYLEHFERGK